MHITYSLQLQLFCLNIVFILSFVAFLGFRYKYFKEEVQTNYVKKVKTDFDNIKNGLENYHKKNEEYPIQPNWSGYIWWNGYDTNWIPHLVPEYLSQLPREPHFLTDFHQYIYKSNGIDYKLLVHKYNYFGSKIVPQGLNIDPERNFAVGYWTIGATHW